MAGLVQSLLFGTLTKTVTCYTQSFPYCLREQALPFVRIQGSELGNWELLHVQQSVGFVPSHFLAPKCAPCSCHLHSQHGEVSIATDVTGGWQRLGSHAEAWTGSPETENSGQGGVRHQAGRVWDVELLSGRDSWCGWETEQIGKYIEDHRSQNSHCQRRYLSTLKQEV